MPFYDYCCQKCENQITVLQRRNDLPPANCAACGAVDSMQRQIGLCGFSLNGSGWYKDGYESKADTKKEKA